MRALLLSLLLVLSATAPVLAQPAGAVTQVHFRQGGRAVIPGQLRAAATAAYAAQGVAGQTLSVRVISADSLVYFTLTAPDGQVVYDGSTAANPDAFSGPLAQTGAYRIDVRRLPDPDAPAGTVRWVLSVSLTGG